MTYLIAKNRVIGMCKVSNDDYSLTIESLEYKIKPSVFPWTLTADDYLVAYNANTNKLVSDGEANHEGEWVCFICYWKC